MSPASAPPVEPRNQERTLVPVAVQNYQTITDQLRANNGADAKALRAMFAGDKKLTDRFLSVAFSLLATDSDLLTRATPMSIIEAIKRAASLGLEPMTEDAAIVRYGDKAQLLPMFRGYLKRMRRSGLVKNVDAKMVYENDEFDHWEDETGFHFRHHPTKTERGDYWGAYAYVVMADGFVHGNVMTVSELNYVRDTWGRTQSQSGKPLPWATSYDQMCLKTVIRRLAKIMPQEAVGVEFLALERDSDNAEDKVRILEKQVNNDLADVRALALRAVGALPEATTQEGTPEAAGPESSGEELAGGPLPAETDPEAPTAQPSEPQPYPAAESTPTTAVTGAPGPDPLVAAAMELAAEQEKLRRFRAGK